MDSLFKIVDVTPALFSGDANMIEFTLKTALGERKFCGEHINTDDEGNKTVERTNSNLRHNLRQDISDLFDGDIPWRQLFDQLDIVLATSKDR